MVLWSQTVICQERESSGNGKLQVIVWLCDSICEHTAAHDILVMHMFDADLKVMNMIGDPAISPVFVDYWSITLPTSYLSHSLLPLTMRTDNVLCSWCSTGVRLNSCDAFPIAGKVIL